MNKKTNTKACANGCSGTNTKTTRSQNHISAGARGRVYFKKRVTVSE